MSEAGAYIVLEIGSWVFFLVCLCHASHSSTHKIFELLSAFLYGLLLEEGDILLFQTYGYNPGFILKLDQVPVSIALDWAVIIYTCMHLSDCYQFSARVAPFADSLLGIIMDISFDAIAIRLGLWHWTNLPLDHGFFGVPPGNFYAWLFVILFFSLGTRKVRQLSLKRGGYWPFTQFLVPLIAYVGLVLAIFVYALLKYLIYENPNDYGSGMPIFAGACVFFLWVVLRDVVSRVQKGIFFPSRPDFIPIVLRHVIHGVFLLALLLAGIHHETPALLWISCSMIGIELAICHFPRSPRRHELIVPTLI